MYIGWWIITWMLYFVECQRSWDEYIEREKTLNFWVFAPLIPPTAFLLSLVASMIVGDVLGYGVIAFFALKFTLWVIKKRCGKRHIK